MLPFSPFREHTLLNVWPWSRAWAGHVRCWHRSFKPNAAGSYSLFQKYWHLSLNGDKTCTSLFRLFTFQLNRGLRYQRALEPHTHWVVRSPLWSLIPMGNYVEIKWYSKTLVCQKRKYYYISNHFTDRKKKIEAAAFCIQKRSRCSSPQKDFRRFCRIPYKTVHIVPDLKGCSKHFYAKLGF